MGRKRKRCAVCSHVHPSPDDVRDLVAAAKAARAGAPPRAAAGARLDHVDAAPGADHEPLPGTRGEDRVQVRALVAYDGRHFHGFQRTLYSGVWELRTVQGAIEEAFAHEFGMLDPACTIVGSSFLHDRADDPALLAVGPRFGHALPQFSLSATSRTDAGVSALQQVISLWIPRPHAQDLARLNDAMRARLGPQNIALNLLESVRYEDRWTVQGSVRGKRYRYTVYDGLEDPHVICEAKVPPGAAWEAARDLCAFADLYNAGIRASRKHLVQTLDAEEMDAAAQGLAGGEYRNFRLFTRSARRTGRLTSHRVLHRIRVLRTGSASPEIDFSTPHDPDGGFVHILVEGEKFLYLMVRCIAQVLIDVGRGRLDSTVLLSEGLHPPDDEDRIHREQLVFHAAPANGLTLVRTYYSSELFDGVVAVWPHASIPRPAESYVAGVLPEK